MSEAVIRGVEIEDGVQRYQGRPQLLGLLGKQQAVVWSLGNNLDGPGLLRSRWRYGHGNGVQREPLCSRMQYMISKLSRKL